jgi:WD40-like Beta Propeller Repeat
MLGTRTVIALSLAAAVVGTAAPADRAWADYGPGAIPASAAGRELGSGSSPALSGDGRYVAFSTAASVLLGPAPNPDQYHSNGIVWKDLESGEIRLVAPPERRWRSDGEDHSAHDLVDGSPRFAGTPSISADGRRVLFATTAQLAITDTNSRNSDVYVRDMTRPLSQTGGGPGVRAYELVSARDGTESSPTYIDQALGAVPGRGGAALSDDGLTAVFVTEGRTTLPNGSGIAPRWQVFVRSLETRTTLLVTRDRQDPALPGTPVPPAGGQGINVPTQPQPVLSGDGTTVAWEGSNAGQQARFLPGEPQSLVNLLWRDMSAGPAAPTRRVSGVADPDDPACPPSFTWPDRIAAERATGPCYGPFATGEAMDRDEQRGASTRVGLSDDGLRVLFQSEAYLRPRDELTFRPGSIYLADMSPGVSRKQGTVRILSVPQESLNQNRGVTELGMSGDGRYAAFASRGAAFDGPRPIGSFQTGELDTTNVFMLDLAAGTVERVTRAASGGDYRGQIPRTGTGSGVPTDPQPRNLTVADGGAAVAFSAGDGNLFIGDANDTGDVHVVRRSGSGGAGGPGWALAAPPGPPPIDLTEPPLAPLRPVHPVFGHVRLGRGGVAIVTVRVPAAGRVTGRATGRVTGRATSRQDARRAAKVPVGSDGARPRRAATVTLRIRPSRAARSALRRRPHRVAVSLRLRYRPRVGRPAGATRRYTLRGVGDRP